MLEHGHAGPRRQGRQPRLDAAPSITDFQAADALGVRHSFSEGLALRHDALGPFAQLAAEGRFTIPIARTFVLEDWREALEVSVSGRAHGKLMLMIAAAPA